MALRRTRVPRCSEQAAAAPVLTLMPTPDGTTWVTLAVPVLSLSRYHWAVLEDAAQRGRRYQPDETDEFVSIPLDELRHYGLMDGNQITDKGRAALQLGGRA